MPHLSCNPIFVGSDPEELACSIGRPFAILGPRQREIAAIVYSNLAITPRDVQEQLSEVRSVRVIRTLLERMVSKGLVKRRRTGRHREVIYVAAIATPRVKDAAIEKLINEEFGGSLRQAITFTEELAKQQSNLRLISEIPRTPAAMRRVIAERFRAGASGGPETR